MCDPHAKTSKVAGQPSEPAERASLTVAKTTTMVLRKLLDFKGVLGVTLPKEFTNAIQVERGDYAEVYLRDRRTIVIKKHGVKPQKITISD